MPEAPDPALPPDLLVEALARAQREVATALLLSGGMLLAFLMIGLVAAGLRRTGLLFGLAYSLTLCFVPVGHAHLLGPCGAGAALAGLLWPGKRRK
jgi:hypothetical protein